MAKIKPDSKIYQEKAKMTLSEVIPKFLFDKNSTYGSYFDYTEYMWSQKDQPEILQIFFEDLIMVSSCKCFELFLCSNKVSDSKR